MKPGILALFVRRMVTIPVFVDTSLVLRQGQCELLITPPYKVENPYNLSQRCNDQ